ncbi:MAG: biotin--[acetyl-CoA-carboxylase] ligase [Acidobacteriota bacterium]
MPSALDLLASEFLEHRGSGRFGRPIRFLRRVSSTQDTLREWILAEEIPEGAVVVAEEQTAGRGRQSRKWWSRPGAALTFSLLLRPAFATGGAGALDPANPSSQVDPAGGRDGKAVERSALARAAVPSGLGVLSLAAGVAVREAVSCGGLKWPNDLLAPDGRKLAGILIETSGVGGGKPVVLLGVGLNVHAPAPAGGAALEEFVPVPSRGALLGRLLESLERWCRRRREDPAAVVGAWNEVNVVLGRQVRIRLSGEEFTGRALRLNPAGALVVEHRGSERTVTAGEVELLRVVD